MKVLTALGSPRLNGNTAQLLGIFEGALAEAGHEFARADLAGLDIAGCRECMACQQEGAEPLCAIRDDMTRLIEDVKASGALVLAAPVFMWSYPAQAKAFLDRLFCLCSPHRADLAGKRTALILSGGGDAFDGADLIAAGFMKFAHYNRIAHAGQVAAAPMADGVVEPHIRDALIALARAL